MPFERIKETPRSFSFFKDLNFSFYFRLHLQFLKSFVDSFSMRFYLGFLVNCSIPLLFSLAAVSVFGDSLLFKNGDRISGSLINETRTEYVFKTEYGTLRVPMDQVDLEKAPKIQSKPILNLVEGDKTSSKLSHLDRLKIRKAKIRQIFPNSWKGRISSSVEFLESENSRFGFQQKLSTYKKIEAQRYNLNAYYAYSKVSQKDGVSIKTRDEHGANGGHVWDFGEGWFSNTRISYLRDEQRDIQFQVQPTSALGYRVFDDSDLALSFKIGPSWRFIDASQLDTNQVNLINIGQNLIYKFNGQVKFIQSVDYFRSPEDSSVSNTIFRATLASNLTDLLDTRLGYVYDHNNIVGRAMQKKQGRLTLSFGIPF